MRRRLAAAGYEGSAAVVYSAVRLLLPAVLGLTTVLALGFSDGLVLGLTSAALGFVIPDIWLSQKTLKHKKSIQDGLPDALDLIIVCIEAGSSLDQAILKASSELAIALPVIARQLATLSSQIRAGKPRLEAFQDLAKRTGVDDVRSLVAMLIQTDRFGTSIAQGLRTHAETLRTKRRQRAEERAGKIGVKLVFPLVLCLMPALYVVCLGPVAVALPEPVLATEKRRGRLGYHCCLARCRSPCSWSSMWCAANRGSTAKPARTSATVVRS